MPDDRERGHSQVGNEEPDQDIEHESWANQNRHEPMPASRHADRPGGGPREATAASDEPDSAAHARPAAPTWATDADNGAADEDHHPDEGKAIRDMMGGPPPQGDVPDAPATQAAAARDRDGDDDHDPVVTYVANAVPGKPDGEVDTRS